jgi:hypothetical protein
MFNKYFKDCMMLYWYKSRSEISKDVLVDEFGDQRYYDSKNPYTDWVLLIFTPHIC